MPRGVDGVGQPGPRTRGGLFHRDQRQLGLELRAAAVEHGGKRCGATPVPSAGSKWKERIKLLKPYQVNRKALKLTGNPRVRFLHCLPAFHNRETKVGEEIYKEYGLDGIEVFHPDHPEREEAFLRDAGDLGLLVTAGSDFHAEADGGRSLGAPRLAEPFWERLARAATARRREAARVPVDLSPR